MPKKSKKELAAEWARKNDICGNEPWWNKQLTMYNLTVDQIVRMAKYIEKNSNVSK